MKAVLGVYLEHAKGLRSPDTAIHHANRLGPWAEKYRASQARECAAHVLKDMKGVYAPATINRSLGALKKALAIAWDHGLTPENYGLRVKRIAENNAREVFLTVKQVSEIAQHCTAPVQAAIWTALLTGARRGEICQIQRKHIHDSHIEIPASHTKTLKVRAVPIVPALRPWLEHFPLSVGFEGIKTSWQRARVAAGMEHVNFHDLRHSCASILVGLGVDLYTVGEILGHSSTQTTKRYAHLQLGKKADALGKLGALVGSR
jgi:integrase